MLSLSGRNDCWPGVDLVADLALGVVHLDLAQRPLDEHHERRHHDDQRGDAEHQRNRIRAGIDVCSSVCPIARGRPAAMPAKMISEMPLPRPALGDLLAEPHQEHRPGHQRDRRQEAERDARVDHQPGLRFERDRDAEALEEREPQRRVARVLRDLAAARPRLPS